MMCWMWLCFTFVSAQQWVTWPQMLPSLVMLHNTFWDDWASDFGFLTRRRTLDKRLNISYLIEVAEHVSTCTSTHSPSSARSLSPSNRPQDVFQERRLNGDAPMVSLVQPAGLDFLWGCSLAQLCIWKLYMPYWYFEFEKVYADVPWSNFRRVYNTRDQPFAFLFETVVRSPLNKTCWIHFELTTVGRHSTVMHPPTKKATQNYFSLNEVFWVWQVYSFET